MFFEEKLRHGRTRLHVDRTMDSTLTTSLLRHRVVLLSGVVDASAAGRIISSLLLLDGHHHGKPVDLYINSTGGATADGLAVIDAMYGVRAPVRTICMGQATDIAAMILAAGTRGMRHATPNASVCVAGLDSKDDRLPALLARFVDRAQEQVLQAMRQPKRMTAQDAAAFGIIDSTLAGPTKSARTAVTLQG